MTDVLWSSPQQIFQVVVSVLVLYPLGILLVRMGGRRTVAEISAYDVLVTIAIGSIIANGTLPSDTTVIDAAAAIATLLVLQVAVGAIRLRSTRVRRLLDFRPRAVVRDGKAELSESPASAQLSRSELEELLRLQGVADLSQVKLVVLEASGQLSVFEHGKTGGLTETFLRDN